MQIFDQLSITTMFCKSFALRKECSLKKSPERLRCKLCGYLIRNLRTSATNHISFAHSFPYECQQCLFKARGQKALANHYKKTHNTEALVDFIDISFKAIFETVYTMKLGTYMDTDGKVQGKPVRVSPQQRPLTTGTIPDIGKNMSAPQESAPSCVQTAVTSLPQNTLSTSVQTTLPGSVHNVQPVLIQTQPSNPVPAQSHTSQLMTTVGLNLRPQQTPILPSIAQTQNESNTQAEFSTSQNFAPNSAGLKNLQDKGQNTSAVDVVSTNTPSVQQVAKQSIPPSQATQTHGIPQDVLPSLQQAYVAQTRGIILPVQHGTSDNQSEPKPVTGLDLVKSSVHQALETELRSSQQTASEKLGQEEALNICHILAEKEDPNFDWMVENGILMIKMQQGLVYLSARKSKFLMKYASTFSNYPLLGLQHIKEYQKLDIRQDPFYMCELCRDKLGPNTIANHFKSLKHNLWYMGKEHQEDYSTIVALCKDKSILTRSELQREVDSLSYAIMKNEHRPRLIPVFVEKPAPVSASPSLDGSSSASFGNSGNKSTANKTTASTHKTTAASKTIETSLTSQMSSRRHRSGSRDRRHSRSPRSSRRHDRSRERHDKSSRRSSRYETSENHSRKRDRSNERDNKKNKEKRAKIDASVSEKSDQIKKNPTQSTKPAKIVEEDTTSTSIDFEQVSSPDESFDEGDMLTEEDMRILELQLLKQSELDEDELAVHEDLEDETKQKTSDIGETSVSAPDYSTDSATRKDNSLAESGVLEENQIAVTIELTIDSPKHAPEENKTNTDQALEEIAEHAASQGDICVVRGSDQTNASNKVEGMKSLTVVNDKIGGNSKVLRPDVESSSDVVHVNIEIHETSDVGIRNATVSHVSKVPPTVEEVTANSVQSVSEKYVSKQPKTDQYTASSEKITSETSTLESEEVQSENVDNEKEAKLKNDLKLKDELEDVSDVDLDEEFDNDDEDFIMSNLGEGFVTVDDIEDENKSQESVSNIQEKTSIDKNNTTDGSSKSTCNYLLTAMEITSQPQVSDAKIGKSSFNKADFEEKSSYCDKEDSVDSVKLDEEANTDGTNAHNSQTENADVINLNEKLLKASEKEELSPDNIKSSISFDIVNVEIQIERNKEQPEYQDHKTKSYKMAEVEALIVIMDEKVDKCQADSVICDTDADTKNKQSDDKPGDSQMVADDIDLMDELEKALANDEQFFNIDQENEAINSDEDSSKDIIHTNSMKNDTNIDMKSVHHDPDSIIEDKTNIKQNESDVGLDNETKAGAGAADIDVEDNSDADSQGSFDMDNFVLVDEADEDEDIEDEPDSGEASGSRGVSKEQGTADKYRPEGTSSSRREGVPKSRGDSEDSGARVSQTRSEEYERSSQTSSSHGYQGIPRHGNFVPSLGRGSFRAIDKYHWSRTNTEASGGNDRENQSMEHGTGNQAMQQGTGNQAIGGGNRYQARGSGYQTRGRGYQARGRGSGYQTRGRGSGNQTQGNSRGDYNTYGRGSYSYAGGRGGHRGWSKEDSYPKYRGREVTEQGQDPAVEEGDHNPMRKPVK